MDETDVRGVLTTLAATAAPPARFDVGRAVADGRRGRRRRQAVAGGSALAVGAVIGAVVTIVLAITPGTPPAVAPAAHASVTPTAQGTRTPGMVPEWFNPLVPYARFGWLPRGYTTSAAGGPLVMAATNATTIVATNKQGLFSLGVMARGGCKDSGTVVNCHYNSGNVSGPMSLSHRAPDIKGRPAYWTYGDSILWEYTPGTWATLTGPLGYNVSPSAAGRAVLRQVAAGVRYGYRTPLTFPFWLSGMPAGWSISDSEFTDSAPPLRAETLELGPVEKPQAASITVTPAGPGSVCQYVEGDSYVTVDGVRGIETGGGPGSGGAQLCISDLNGQSVVVDLSTRIPTSGEPVPGVAGLGGVVGLVHHLHVLGGRVVRWTTRPLR
jgi:hypothetical protein